MNQYKTTKNTPVNKPKPAPIHYRLGEIQHELLLIGTRGSVPAPAPGERVPSLIQAQCGRHSEKPDIFLHHAEWWFPSMPKLELFARESPPGWGNEVDLAASSERVSEGDELMMRDETK